MYKGYKVVVNTGAGRRENLKLLIPQVLKSKLVDQYDMWINTLNEIDYNFLINLKDIDNRINCIDQPDGFVNGVQSMNAFYKNCCDEKTIYIKLDDDLVYLGENFIEKLLEARVAHDNYFLISPMVINNDLSSYIYQVDGKLNFSEYYAQRTYAQPWYNGYFATQLHLWFLDILDKKNESQLYISNSEVSNTRFSINCIVWFGKDLSLINGVVKGDDEEFLSIYYPSKIRKNSLLLGDTICSHYSFGGQKRQIERAGILEKYEDLLVSKIFNEEESHTYKILCELILKLEKSTDLVSVPYKGVIKNTLSKFKGRIFSILRKNISIDNFLTRKKIISILNKKIIGVANKKFIVSDGRDNLPRL